MRGWVEFGKANGWWNLLERSGKGLHRRARDRAMAQRLHSPGFRAGGFPRLLGLPGITVGEDFHAGDGLWLEAVLRYGEGASAQQFSPRLTIGRHARLSDAVHIACLASVTIGDHLLCGSRVLITDHSHGVYGGNGAYRGNGDREPQSDPAVPPAARPLHSAGSISIGNNVWLGDGVAVLPGAAIGDGCVVGAHAVVTGALPPGTLAVGMPARPTRRWDPERRWWAPIAG